MSDMDKLILLALCTLGNLFFVLGFSTDSLLLSLVYRIIGGTLLVIVGVIIGRKSI